MRYYLANQTNPITIDLVKSIRHNPALMEFEYTTVENEKILHQQHFFIRKLAGNYFSSNDGKRWCKLAEQTWPSQIVSVSQVFDLYRGFRPSGAFTANGGELRTQMPGKVVKINVREGDPVRPGDVLFILEAMKMENEVKSARSGIVKAIHCQEGQTLEAGFTTMELANSTEGK